MRTLARTALVLLAIATIAPTVSAQDGDAQLYRTVFLRAAPGELQTVLDLIEERWPTWQAANEIGPFRMRHSQGDHWDLMLLFHVGDDFSAHFDDATAARNNAAWESAGETDEEFEGRLLPHVAWREELWVWGASADEVADRFADAGYFHVEVFLAVAGRRAELLEQRAMENVYLDEIGREPNLIFSRAAGAAWDSYTIGFYRDIKHFAESADIPADVEDRAAVAAGFESTSTIGTYLRSLITRHHDTLATAIR
ncbi:MAG: hypothetical protein GKS06_03420 [Acidobacteria bacterium]|nr:hypothetical protein [Acidobacteriota bacterium]